MFDQFDSIVVEQWANQYFRGELAENKSFSKFIKSQKKGLLKIVQKQQQRTKQEQKGIWDERL